MERQVEMTMLPVQRGKSLRQVGVMNSAFYAAARIVLMMAGWLVALSFGLAADYMLPGAQWPVFVGLGAWWTFLCILYVRGEPSRRA
jgi:hypothetical protein